MERFKGGVVQSVIVLFGIDADSMITGGHRLNGTTVTTRFRRFEDFMGQSIADIDPTGVVHHSRQIREAVENAYENYRTIITEDQAPGPPSALARIVKKVKGASCRRTPTPVTD